MTLLGRLPQFGRELRAGALPGARPDEEVPLAGDLTVLPTTRCELCDGFVVDEIVTTRMGTWATWGRMVYRMDLLGWVCPTCHTALGPDTVREGILALFPSAPGVG